ncbi:MAG: hypothetical protein ABIV50_15270, partial [Opitutus sp.]
APRISDARRVVLGRVIMVVVLIVCVACAPLIGHYKGLFTYLVKVWSLLAPPVFVCVVAGIFTRWATNRGAIATLATGAVLGAIAFWVLDQPTWLARLPQYLRSSLNVGFLITVVCSGVMWVVSHWGDGRDGKEPLRRLDRTSVMQAMTHTEVRIYRIVLAGLILLLLGLTWTFSPWGVAHHRSSTISLTVR